MTEVYAVGVGMTRFGKFPDRDAFDLGAEASLIAIKDAGIDPRMIDGAYFGHVYQGMNAGQRVTGHIGIAGIPVTNVENVCSSGATAIREAAIAIRAGEHDVVLAVGLEHLTSKFKGALAPEEGDIEGAVGVTMPGVYAMRARRYLEDYGQTHAQLGMVSVKNKANAAMNPFAMYQKTVTIEEVLASRPIAEPLNMMECSPVSDGAAAIILMSGEKARQLGMGRAVRLAASSLRSGKVESEPSSMTFEPLTRATAYAAYEAAGIGASDVDFAEVHDCFSIAEALRVEGLGLFERGTYLLAVARGEAHINGRLPINPSGGLLGKGHPLGATGAAQVVEVVRQLRGEAGPRQIDSPRVGVAHCRGGKAAGVEGAACTVQVLVR
jgi:acetyl-CoA acetyltransferase